jgi:transcription elongation GreA/GreB family factor
VATIGRDLRYWLARRSSAEVKPAPHQLETAAFGVKVTVERDGERRQTYRIVGEDEADPAKGTLSFVSPLGRALMGKAVGDVVTVGKGEVTIVALEG